MNTAHKHYFVRGNTALGLHSLVDSAFRGLGTVYVLQGYTGGTALILKKLAQHLEHQGHSLHLIHDPLNSELLEGIIVPNLQIGFIDEEALPQEPNKIGGVDIQVVPVKDCYDVGKITQASQALTRLQQQLNEAYDTAYASFLKTLRIHDEWEKYYIEHLDREVMNELATVWGDKYLIQNEAFTTASINPDNCSIINAPTTVHRFLGAATYTGAVDYVMNLTDDLDKRFYVKGRPGSGKSTLFKKLASIAQERGISTEIYHCGFDPNSLDMLIFPELSLAIFDSTAPHEHFPSRDGDEIIDVYPLAITPGTDERFAEELTPIKQRYATSMKQSIAYLGEAKEIKDRMADVYLASLDLDLLTELQQKLNQQFEMKNQD